MTAWVTGVQHMVGHHGLARRDELVGLGVSQQLIRRRIRSGQLVEVNRQVVRLPGIEDDLLLRTRAAVLARPDAVPTGLSAAVLLGRGPWDEVSLVGDPWLVAAPDRWLAARFVTHPGLPTVRREGIVIAEPAAAVVDLLRFLERDEAMRVGRAALQRRVLTLGVLHQAQARLGGLRGTRQLRVVIDDLLVGVHSEAERDLVEIMRSCGLTGWIANHPVRIGSRLYYIDVAFPRALLAIEVDGRAFHSDARAFRRDRQRQNDLVAAGWTVLRFTWEDLREDPSGVVDQIVRALQRARTA